MTAKFSRKNFERNAQASVKKALPESHRIALDGLTVVFAGKYGTATYDADGEDWTLYPVEQNWCEEESN